MAQVHPFKFTTSILELAQQKGATLISGRATSLNQTSITYLPSPNHPDPHTLPATTIILTTGPWTQSLLPTIPISTSRAHSIIIRPPTPPPPPTNILTHPPPPPPPPPQTPQI